MKKLLIQLFFIVTPLFLIISLVSGCANSVSVTDTDTGIITGQITTFEETGISGARIYVDDMYVSANSSGWYTINDVPESDRVVVRIEKDGYIPAFKITKVDKNNTTLVNASLLMQNRVHTKLDPLEEQTVTDNLGEIVIPANGLTYDDSIDNELFTGTYQCSITMIDPSLEHGKDIFPGEFKGLTPGATVSVPIISYGFFNLTLNDEETGRKLQLASGQTARIKVPIPAELQDEADDYMGYWSFNEDEGVWYLEGTLEKNISSNAYEGEVGHFSFFGTAEVYNPGFISGTVLDCDENPFENVEVIISGTDPNNSWRSVVLSTPEDGFFNIPVYPEANAVITVNENGISTDFNIEIPTPPSGEANTEQLGDIIACSSVKMILITLTWLDHPRDLDAHLVIQPESDSDNPSNSDSQEEPVHIWYKMPNAGHVKLLEDNSKGSGSEIFEIYELINGTYRFSVHHYAGSSSMAGQTKTIEAKIEIEDFGGESRIQTLSPPSEGDGVNDIWNVWDIVVINNDVEEIIEVNTISKVKDSIFP